METRKEEGAPSEGEAFPRRVDWTTAVCFLICVVGMQMLARLCVVSFDAGALAWRIATVLMGIVALGVLAFAIRDHLDLLARRLWRIAAPIAGAMGFLAVLVGLRNGLPVFVALGLSAAGIGVAWAFVQTALSAAKLDRRRRTVSLLTGFAGYLIVSSAIPAASDSPWCLVLCALGLGCVSRLLAERVAGELRSFTCSAAPSDLAATNPGSFLPFSNKLFVMILLFACMSGYGHVAWSLAAPLSARLVPLTCLAATVAIGVLVAVVSRGKPDVDDFYYAALLSSIVGFAFVTMPAQDVLADSVGHAALAVMFSGSNLFMLFVWLLFFELSSRNVWAAPSLVLFGVAAFEIGVFADSLIWTVAIELEQMGLYWDNLIAVVFFCCFVVYAILFLRGYSFEDVISSIRPVELPVAKEEGTLDEVCAAMIERFGLTPRESDIFPLLARGRNSRFIESALVVSRNTVKTHTRNIYRKLGVHSQQQLIDAVEQEQDAPETSE